MTAFYSDPDPEEFLERLGLEASESPTIREGADRSLSMPV